MSNHEEILSYFKQKVHDMVNSHSVYHSSPVYSNPFVKMSAYFGQFNANMVELEDEVNTEATNILLHLKEDMDIATVINEVNVFRKNSRLQFISSNKP